MWRSKKFIVAAVLATVLVVGSIGGIALAQENGDDSQTKTLLARVAEKLGVELEVLKGYFAEARSEMRDEAIQKLADEGKITQEQADQYKAWLKSRPDMEQFRQQLKEWQLTRPDMPLELKEWLEASPDMPVGFGFRGPRGFRGFGGPCGPP